MSILYQHEVIRKAGKLSQNEIQNLSFLSHQKDQYSARARKWCELANKSYSELLKGMQSFLKSKEAIQSVKDLPKEIHASINYGLNNQENFSTNQFLSRLQFENQEDGTKESKKFHAAANNLLSKSLDRCADTALAIWRTGDFSNKDFDIIRTFKLVHLVKDALNLDQKDTRLNGPHYIGRPFILNIPCITEIDPCKGKKTNSTKTSEIATDGTILNNEENCGCEDLKAKEKACNCDKKGKKDCDCKCEDECVDQNPCCAKIETFLAELFIVRDDVSCYKPGEISYIENVMMGETKVRKHRHLQREEIYTETEEVNNSYKERDTQIDERSSVHKEIDKIIESDFSVDAGAKYSSRAGGKNTYQSFSADLDVSYSQSRKNAKKIVQDQSKNVIDRAIERVEKNIRTLQSKRRIEEIEEKNKHVLDGTQFSEHENGIYFFVNQERKAQIYSYGVREMIDLYVPDPSLRLKSLLEKEFELEKPTKPCLDIKDIQPSDYLNYVQCYGFTDLEKPAVTPPVKWIHLTFKEEPRDQHWSLSQQITIEPGYTATQIVMQNPTLRPQLPKEHHRLRIIFGGGEVHKEVAGLINGTDSTQLSDNISTTGTSNITLTTLGMKEFEVKVSIKLTPDPADNTDWQISIFGLIMEQYEQELADYEKALAEFQRNKESKFNQNPFMLSETIKEQLKHSALEYITCQFFDAKNGMRHRVRPCGLPQMDIPETAEFAKKVRFFEQAFEWKFMSYMLYPYYWADKCTWEDKLGEEARNGLFQKFLQSGYARVSVSIRPNYEGLVNYFLNTGQLWYGTGTPPLSGPNYLPIHQEIKESKDNFNTDRKGYLMWDSAFTTTPPAGRQLNRNEILIKGDGKDEYYTLDTDPLSPTFGTLILDTFKVARDLNREVFINCLPYRIISIREDNGELIILLDKDLVHKDPVACPDDFDNRYKDKNILWSTGAKFEGAPWSFKVPTSLTWLKEDECLPCYPISCKENC